MKKVLRWVIGATVMLVIVFTILDFINTAGDTGDPNAQLATMLPAERQFCEQVLWQIDSSSTERDVLTLLGPPSRSLKFKKNWWVELDGKKDRVGVFFNASGFATDVVLDGGTGRFYYKRDVKDHERLGQKDEDKERITRDEKWLEGYAGQTTEELIALQGECRRDSLVLAFEQALDQKAFRVGQDVLTGEERVVLAVEALEREVNNGGYKQFFINSSREYTPIVVDALDRIGCTEVAALTQQAIDILGIKGPVTVEAVDRVMDHEDKDRDDRLDECDERYCKVAGDLADPLLEFIKGNRDKITLKE